MTATRLLDTTALGLVVALPSTLLHRWAWQRSAIAAYDRLYRWVNGLDQPGSLVGPVLRLKVRRSRRTVHLGDGSVVRRGERIGTIHLNNERVVALRADSPRSDVIGIVFRRQFLTSLGELGRLTDPGGPLAEVRAFSATTILHRGLGRLGFEPARKSSEGSAVIGAYQRALLASLRPARRARLDAAIRHRARELWISREALRARFRRSPHSTAAERPSPGSEE